MKKSLHLLIALTSIASFSQQPSPGYVASHYETTIVDGSNRPATSEAVYEAIQIINAAIALKANDNAVVHTTGNETIGGNKTISGTTNLSALTATTVLLLDASKNIVSSGASSTTQYMRGGDFTWRTFATDIMNATIGTLVPSNTAIASSDSFKTAVNKTQGQISALITDKANVASPVFTGTVTSPAYKLSALQTAPASASDTGTLGEIRITATYIYICTATNTWVRAALSTW